MKNYDASFQLQACRFWQEDKEIKNIINDWDYIKKWDILFPMEKINFEEILYIIMKG